MKRITTNILFLMTLFVFQLQAQIFVSHDASGAADGSSWENAFTDLQAAIASSSVNDEIWVSAGTYNPGGTSPNNTSFFALPHDLKLYGGFAGTETMLSQRAWTTNVTALSGDINGDDIDGNFDVNKEDNSYHVFFLTDTITPATLIDGFSIRGGSTLIEDLTDSDDDRRGGAILSYGAPTIQNCIIEQNSGRWGGGIHVRLEGASNFVIDNCIFRNNRAVINGGALFNILTEAGTISNCTFDMNNAGNRGGGILNRSSGATFANCNFSRNQATSNAGALFINNPDSVVITVDILNCDFISNTCLDWTGAMAIFGSKTTANIADCTFDANSCTGNGGALLLGFQSVSNFTNCIFNENSAPTGRGGAIHMQNQGTKLNVDKCIYTLNNAEIGGAISNGGPIVVGDSMPLIQLDIRNSFFELNTAITQGGAINTTNSTCDLTNSVFAYNIVINNDGAGGAVIFNTIDSVVGSYSLMNCTVVNNQAGIGAGVAHWNEGTEGSSILTMQNTILANPAGVNYEIENGTPEIISNGGNLTDDFSLFGVFNDTNDLLEVQPLFVSPNTSDFRLQDDSPCVDGGVADGAPLLDIDGNERVDAIDMGAYENQKLTSVNSLNQMPGELDIFPNPVDQKLNFSFKVNKASTFKSYILDAQGKRLSTHIVGKNGQIADHVIDVENLPQGIYYLQITDGISIKTKSFFKK